MWHQIESQLMRYPPSTGRHTPVIIDALSLNKKATASATSSGSANLFKGIRDLIGPETNGSDQTCRPISEKKITYQDNKYTHRMKSSIQVRYLSRFN